MLYLTMKFKIKKVVIHLLSFIIGGVFIFSALSKYYPIESFEFTIVETGFIGWKFSLILARIIIAIELALGILFLFSYQLMLISKITLGLLLVFTSHLVYTLIINGNLGDCGCFGELLPMTPLQGIIKNVALIVLVFILFRSKYQLKSKIEFLPLYTFILSNIFIFTQNAVDYTYSTNYLNKSFENFKLNIDTIYNTPSYEKIGKPIKDIRNEKLIICFLSSSCEHCRIAAKKFAVIKKFNINIPLYFFINGDDEDIENFKKRTNIEAIPSSKLNGETFIKLAGVHLPVIYYYNKGIVEKQVDYYTLEQYHIEQWLAKE